jgi:hypothetical protein
MMREILKNAYQFSQSSRSEQVPFDDNVIVEASRRATAASAEPRDDYDTDLQRNIVVVMHRYAVENAAKLHLDPDRKISVLGFHPVFRVAPRGQLLVEMVVQFAQRDETFEKDVERSGGLPLRGGTTVIAAANGDVRYVIAKPLESKKGGGAKRREAKARRQRQEEFVNEADSRDARLAWSDDKYYRKRVALSLNFNAIHSGFRR